MTTDEFIRSYLTLGDKLYRLAFHLLGSQEEAEDAVQDLFIKVWGRKDDLDRVNSPQAWCLTLLRNLCIDRLRARQRTVPLEENITEEEVPRRSLRIRETLSAIRVLPPGSRELLRMRLIEGLSYDEISQKTGFSKVALRVAFHRLKKQLRKKI